MWCLSSQIYTKNSGKHRDSLWIDKKWVEWYTDSEVNIMSNQSLTRSPAMDVVRSFALLFVISVHFLLNSGYYDVPVKGPVMFLMTVLRSIFIICVPLFMVLSGYLTNQKKPNKAYFSKIIYVLAIYVMASLCCVGYKMWVQHQEFTVAQVVRALLDYKAAPYAWYVEMYIGLFLLCPFLNLIYNNLKDKKEKQLLLAILLFLTALPKVVNVFIPSWEWLQNPSSSKEYWNILPDYWLILYPITYYFIGCYLKEYKLKWRPRTLALLSLLLMVVNGAYVYYRSYNVKYIWGAWQDYGSLLVVAQTVLFFAFFDQLNYEKFPSFLAKCTKRISTLSFGAYLVSWVFDQYFYGGLKQAQPDILARMKYFPLIVPLVLIFSLLASFILNTIYDGLVWLVQKGKARRAVCRPIPTKEQ